METCSLPSLAVDLFAVSDFLAVEDVFGCLWTVDISVDPDVDVAVDVNVAVDISVAVDVSVAADIDTVSL